jgi:hypothetical protein
VGVFSVESRHHKERRGSSEQRVVYQPTRSSDVCYLMITSPTKTVPLQATGPVTPLATSHFPMEAPPYNLSSRAQPSDCLFCQACEGWFGCGKDVDGVHLGNAAAFPTFPQRCGGWGFLRKQNSRRWRLSELLQHIPSFGIESHQEFMSQGDANHFLGFAGRR